MVNWFCCHTQFRLFLTFLNTLFLPTCCTYIYDCLQWSFAFFLCYSSSSQFCFSFIHIILCFALLNLCSYHVSTKKHNRVNKEKKKKKKKGIRDTKQWCSVNAFFISRHYRCVAILHIHIYVYTYIGKSIENVAPKRWKMTICMPSNWFACHFIHTAMKETCIIPIYTDATSWLDIIGNIVDFQVSLHSFDILEWCQHIENIFMSSTWAEKIS